jgi:predicted DNA-binding protein with PD1-like motif
MRVDRSDTPGTGWVIVLDTGEELVGSLTGFAREHRILGASIRAIGAFSSARLAYFDWDAKEYRTSVDLQEQVELVSLIGDIAEKDGEPQLHAHAAVAVADGRVLGGHVQAATVRPTCEIILTETPEPLRKKVDPESGLALIRL